MIKRPKISVIIPVYNSEDFLDECLSSLLRQTLNFFELIFIDDGSTDKSVFKIVSYMQKDARIQLYQQKHQGPGPARNLGVNVSTGEYLLFLDSDDFFEPDMFEKLYHKAIKEKTDVIFYWYSKFDHLKQLDIKVLPNPYLDRIPEGEVFNPREYADILFQLSGGEAWKYCFKADFVKKYHFEFGRTLLGEDGSFTYPARAMANRMCFLNEPFVHYRINTNKQLTHGSHLKRELKKAYRQTWKNLKKFNRHQALKKSFQERKRVAKIWLKNATKK